MRHDLRTIALLACAAALTACTFPDVDYASDSGTGGSSSAGSESCADLAQCTSAAASCANMTAALLVQCDQRCKNDPVCATKCQQQVTTVRAGCAMTCATCAGGCAMAAASCRTSAGL